MLERCSHLFIQNTDQVRVFSSFSPRTGPCLGATSEPREIRRICGERGSMSVPSRMTCCETGGRREANASVPTTSQPSAAPTESPPLPDYPRATAPAASWHPYPQSHFRTEPSARPPTYAHSSITTRSHTSAVPEEILLVQDFSVVGSPRNGFVGLPSAPRDFGPVADLPLGRWVF
jgi:hypothetical protein